jgi:hypothetical protein
VVIVGSEREAKLNSRLGGIATGDSELCDGIRRILTERMLCSGLLSCDVEHEVIAVLRRDAGFVGAEDGVVELRLC